VFFLYLLVTGLVLFLPGWACLAWLPNGQWDRRDLLERLADAAGLSIALTALVGMAGFFLGLRLPAAGIIGLYGSGLAALLLAFWKKHANIQLPTPWEGLGLLALAALLAFRLYQARNLALPPWVDGVQHTLVVQKILELGGLPVDLNPVLPVPFFYHFSFHLLAASLAQLSGLAAPQAVLLLGQVLNALVSLAVYRLAKVLLGESRRAALAALLAGFAFQMPAYFLSWGRYTLVTGLVALPVAMAWTLELASVPVQMKKHAWQSAAVLALLVAGVCLSHYLLAGLLGLWVIVVGFYSTRFKLPLPHLKGAPKRRGEGKGEGESGSSLNLPWPLLADAFAGLLLASPWLGRVLLYGSRLAKVEVVFELPQMGTGSLDNLLALLGPERNLVLLGLGLAGLVWAFFRPGLRAFAAWTLLVTALAMPWGLRFNPFRPDQVAIVLFLPAAILLGELLVSASQALGRRVNPWLGQAALLLAAGGLLVWGAVQTAVIVNPDTLLADQADLQALDWVRQNTPAAARFFINTVLWQTASYRGVDGGYWLPVLAGRWALLPPAMYGWGSRDEIQQVNRLAQAASQVTTCDSAFWSLVQEIHLTHIYVKAGRGSLTPAALASCVGLQRVYAAGGVEIWQIK